MSKFTRRSSISGLILNRKIGEQIIINHGEIVLEVVDIVGKNVRLCFKANQEISILRAEVVDDPIQDEDRKNWRGPKS